MPNTISHLNNSPRIILLIGMMGSGKSTVGRQLADSLGYNFVDTDELIERDENMEISEIFTKKGEAYFRKLESDFIRNFKTSENIIISTGGGLPIYNDNLDACKRIGTTIYLKVGVTELHKRLTGDSTRPLLNDNISTLKSILDKRRGIYEQADIVVMGSRPAPKIVRTIIKKL